jgi:fatty-acyl-CoA synthase
MDAASAVEHSLPHLPDPRRAHAVGATDLPLRSIDSWSLLTEAAQRWPRNEAVVACAQDRRLSYAELVDQAALAAAGLQALGIAAGDRIGIWSANRIEWVVFEFAAARIGAVLVNVNPAYLEGELQYVLQDSGCRLLALSARYRNNDCLQMALMVRAQLPALEHLLLVDDTRHPDCTAWQDLLALGRKQPSPEAARVAPDVLANLQYTSGTTGRPKGTMLSHASMINNATLIARRLGLSDQDRVCLPVPMFHCFGMVIGVLGAVGVGATVVMPGETFDAGVTLNVIAAERCTSIYAVPTMFIALMTHERFDSSQVTSLKSGLMGGALCPASVIADCERKMHMRELCLVYGMTETSPISLQSFTDDALEDKQQSVGRVHDHTEVRIVDSGSSQVLAPGEIGELQVRGYLVMLGYWQNPEATRATIDAEGWLTSGDLASMDARGFVQIVGRSKDLVIRGGENIYPREVEETLRSLSGVADAHVFGIPDSYYGEQLCAWIKPLPGAQLAEADIKAGCKEKIAAFKVPYFIRFVDEYPSTASGKVQKFRMREMEISERAQSAAQASPTSTTT